MSDERPDEAELKKQRDSLFTIGELSAIYHIPKPTLVHYYRHGLLIPAYTDPKNGYNYFHSRQFLTMEIIFNLRLLDIPLKDIKEFLDRKSPARLAAMLDKKARECERQVADNGRIAAYLRRLLASLERVPQLPLDQIELAFQPARPLKTSAPLADEMTSGERVARFTEHKQSLGDAAAFRCRSTGWIVRAADFFAGRLNKTHKYFTLLTDGDALSAAENLPAGLYLKLHFRGTYYKNAAAVQKKLAAFIERNDLEVIGDVYNLPVRDYWQTDDTGDYINCLFLPVRYNDAKNK